jgi:hypothetical protein
MIKIEDRIRFVLSCVVTREYQRITRKGTYGSSPDSSFWCSEGIFLIGSAKCAPAEIITLTPNYLFSVMNSVHRMAKRISAGLFI